MKLILNPINICILTRRSILLLLVLIMCKATIGQNYSDLSNYMAFKPLINSAANCEYDNFAGILIGRRQWVGMEGAPSSLGMQFVKPFYSYAIGGSLLQETVGVHNQQRVMFNYSYTLSLASNNKLSFGLGAGGIVLTSDYNKVNPSDWNDDQFSGIKTIASADFNFGIFLSNKKYFAGISVPRIVESSIINNNGKLEGKSDYDPMLWTYLLTGGYIFEINSNYSLTSATLLKLNLNAPIDLDINFNLNTEKYGFGISYRTMREAVFFADLSISKEIILGYCFHSYFTIKNSYLAGHEIYLKYQFQPKKGYIYQTPRF